MADLAQDRDAIRDLLARYTYNGDRGRLGEMTACFAARSLQRYGARFARGLLPPATPLPGTRPSRVLRASAADAPVNAGS